MRIKNIVAMSTFIICIITISLLSSGGCDLEFGGGGGGGNDGGNLVSIVLGTINPPDNSGITVVLIDNNDGTVFPSDPTVTDSSGDFFITGDFNGCLTLRLEFQNSNEDVIAFTNVTVFPKTNLDLGFVSLDNGNVILDEPDKISVKFDANINLSDAPETCSGDPDDSEGTIVVTRGNTDITVQINPSTNIEDKNNQDIGCDTLLSLGNVEVEVTGILQVHDTVLAEIISLK